MEVTPRWWQYRVRTNGCHAPIWFEGGRPYCYKCSELVLKHPHVLDNGEGITWYEMANGETDEYSGMLEIMSR